MGLDPQKLKSSTTDECHQGHDGCVDSELVTGFLFEIQRLHSQTIFEGSQRCAFVYSEPGSADSVYTLSEYSTFLRLPHDSKNSHGSVCSSSPFSGNAKLRALLQGRSFIDYFCVFRGLICFPLFRAFVMIKLFTSGSLIFRTFNTIFTLGQLHLLYWTESSPGTKSSSKCNRTNSLWPKSPYPSGTDPIISGFGPPSCYTPANPTFGPWKRP